MKTENEKRIEEMQAKVDEVRERLNATQREYSLAEAALHEARGETFEARWSRAIAERDVPAAHRYWVESSARRVLAGRETVEDFERSARAEIAAEVERLRAAGTEAVQ
jgi:predicted nuclease with TOPRIM domain